MTRISLDFSSLPTFESTPFFFRLPDEVDIRLRQLSNVYARCNAALRFNSWVGGGSDFLHVREEEVPGMSAACLRAALMEYAGMEEALRLDLPRGTAGTRIDDTRNAMLVILRALRNVQVHVVRTVLISSRRDAYSLFNGERHDHEITALTVPESDLARLRDARKAVARYVHDDYERAITWLAEAQEHWGITDVVMRGIWEYARVISANHTQEQPVPLDPA